MGSLAMRTRASRNLDSADRALYEQGHTQQISNSILKELLLAADRDDTAEGDGVGLPAIAHAEIIGHENLMEEICADLAAEHERSLAFGGILGRLDGGDLATAYETRSEAAEEVTRAAETAAEVSRAGAMAAFPIAIDEQKPDVASLYRVGQDLLADLGTFRKGFDLGLSAPGTSSVAPGASLADELERIRPDVTLTIEMAEALQGFDPGEQDAQAVADRIATITDGRGADGNARFLLQAMFAGGVPYELCEAFCIATGQAMADHPAETAAALARAGLATGGDDLLATELGALGREVEAADGFSFRVATTPDLATVELVEVWSSVVRANNAMADYEAAYERVVAEGGEEAEAGDLDRLKDGPDEAMAAFAKAAPYLSVGRRLEALGLGSWRERMERARGQGRLEARVRKGFELGQDDDATVLDVTLDIAGRALALQARAESAATSAGLAALGSGGPAAGALASALGAIKTSMTLQEKVEILRKHGLMSAQGGEAAGEAGLAIAGLTKAASGIAGNAVTLLQAVSKAELAELDSLSGGFTPSGMASVAEFNSRARRAALVQKIEHLDGAIRLCKGLGAIGDVAGVITGVVKIVDGDVVGGGLDIAAGGLGLASAVAGGAGLGSGAAIGAAGGTLSTVAGPLGLGLAYLSMVHESLTRAYSGFRDVSVRGVAKDFNALLIATRQAQTKAAYASNAVELHAGATSDTERKVYLDAIRVAEAAARTVHDRCEDALNVDGWEFIAHRGSGWVDEIEPLRTDYDTTTSGAYDLLLRSGSRRSIEEAATLFAAGSSQVFKGAGNLGEALRARVESYIEAQAE